MIHTEVFQAAIYCCLWLFPSSFHFTLKITAMHLQHTPFPEAFAVRWQPFHSSSASRRGCVTYHRTKLCFSQPQVSRNRSEQPNAQKRIMKLFCHFCTGRLKAVKWLSSWKWVR